MNKICKVYWIHLPEHTDIFSQGYVGITVQDVCLRFKQHKSYARYGSYPLSKAIRKYSEKLVIDTLVVGSVDYCYTIEGKLRPVERIGWNLIQGGLKVKPFTRHHTDEAKRKIGEGSKRTRNSEACKRAAEARFGRKHSEEAKSKMRLKACGRESWETSRSFKYVWERADEIYEIYKENYWLGSIEIEKLLGLDKDSLKVMVKKFKNNWNPIEDQKWIRWVLSL